MALTTWPKLPLNSWSSCHSLLSVGLCHHAQEAREIAYTQMGAHENLACPTTQFCDFGQATDRPFASLFQSAQLSVQSVCEDNVKGQIGREL